MSQDNTPSINPSQENDRVPNLLRAGSNCLHMNRRRMLDETMTAAASEDDLEELTDEQRTNIKKFEDRMIEFEKLVDQQLKDSRGLSLYTSRLILAFSVEILQETYFPNW